MHLTGAGGGLEFMRFSGRVAGSLWFLLAPMGARRAFKACSGGHQRLFSAALSGELGGYRCGVACPLAPPQRGEQQDNGFADAPLCVWIVMYCTAEYVITNGWFACGNPRAGPRLSDFFL